MIIAVDFDGTIARSVFPTILGEVPMAKEVINKLRGDGHYIIVNTCRAGKDLLDAVNWMLDVGISFDLINDNHPENIRLYQNNTRKINADVYIDDRNVGGFMGWEEVYNWIRDKMENT